MTREIDHFVTYFTSEFTTIGIVSIKRFLQVYPHAHGVVYCFDDESKILLNAHINVDTIKIVNFQKSVYFANIKDELRKDRSELEFLVSIKPLIMYESLLHCAPNQILIYFDPDVMFYSKVSLDKFSNSSFLVYQQKGLSCESIQNYGKYNAGIVVVKNDMYSKAILKLWREKCFSWCRLVVETDRYADQKYLNHFEEHPGFASESSWSSNLSARAFAKPIKSVDLKKLKDGIYINGRLLETFHFHGLRLLSDGILTGFNRFGSTKMRYRLFVYIYLPIISSIFELEMKMRSKSTNSLQLLAKFDKTLIYEKESNSAVVRFIVNFYRVFRLSRIPSRPVKVLLRLQRTLWRN